MKERKFIFIWANGSKSATATTLIKAAKKLNLKNKKIDLGLLVKVRIDGISYWWDSREFIKHTGLKRL